MNVQHTYRIRHRGIESTPLDMTELRQMWRSGAIDKGTQFKRADSEIWLAADNLLPELERAEEQRSTERHSPATAAGPEASPFLSFQGLAPIAPHSVRLTSIRVPFREILFLVVKLFLAVLIVASAGAALWMLLARYLD